MATKFPAAPSAQTVDYQEPTDLLDDIINGLDQTPLDGEKSLSTYLPACQRRLIESDRPSESSRASFPAPEELTNSNVKSQLTQLKANVNDNGASQANRDAMQAMRKKVIAQLTRVRGIRNALKGLAVQDRKDKNKVVAALNSRAEHLNKVLNNAQSDTLRATAAQRSAILSTHAMFDTAGCDGNSANTIAWSNISPVTDATTKARKEVSFKDLPTTCYINGFRPLTDIAVDAKGNPYPVTLLPLSQKLVFQTRCSLIVLGGEFSGLRDVEFWGQIAYRAGAVAIANASYEKLGKKPFTTQTVQDLVNCYTSQDPACKSIVVCGNHAVGFDQSSYSHECDPVLAYGSALYGGKLYGNAEVRGDLSFTNPPTNPNRDRICGSWFAEKLSCPALRDQHDLIKASNLALLMEVSNTELNGINVVFSSSNTAYRVPGNSPHSAELELGTNLARAIVTHYMLMCKGTDLTDEGAQAAGRSLNSTFRNASGYGQPFLHASCDAMKSHVQDQVQRKDDGTSILDAAGNPVLTGKKEIVHEISITFREGAENFVVFFVP